jgi:putative acetyltransferase
VTYTIELEADADLPEVLGVVHAAFGGEGSRIVRLVQDLHTDKRAGVIARTAHRVVGHTQLNRCWVDAEQELVEVLVLSPLSVSPDQQGRGIGTALLMAARQAAEELGFPMLFLEGSPSYYGQRGFQSARTLGFESPSERIPEAAFQVVRLPGYEPWMRGRLVYCDAFWRHDCVGLRNQQD